MPEENLVPQQVVSIPAPVSPLHSGRSSLVFKITIGLVGLFVVGTLASAYLFYFVPEVQAKDFVRKTSTTFSGLLGSLDDIYGSFQKIKDQVPLAKSSFDETATPTTDYNYIKKDTADDIADITKLQASLKEAQEELANLPKPKKVKKLAVYLDDYYQNLDKTLENLLAHQTLSQDLIEAHGQELYDEELKLEAFFTNGGGSRQELLTICENLASLSKISLEKTQDVVVTDPPEEDYKQSKVDYLTDMNTTFESVQPLIKTGQDIEATNSIFAFGGRVKTNSERVYENSKKYVETSIAAQGFAKMDSLEEKVDKELAKLSKELNLDIDKTKPKESSSSAN